MWKSRHRWFTWCDKRNDQYFMSTFCLLATFYPLHSQSSQWLHGMFISLVLFHCWRHWDLMIRCVVCGHWLAVGKVWFKAHVVKLRLLCDGRIEWEFVYLLPQYFLLFLAPHCLQFLKCVYHVKMMIIKVWHLDQWLPLEVGLPSWDIVQCLGIL